MSQKEKRHKSEISSKKVLIESEYMETKKRKNSFKMELANTFNDSKNSPGLNPLKSSVKEELQLDEYTKTFLESKNRDTIVIGICGGPSSGKSFIIKWLKNQF